MKTFLRCLVVAGYLGVSIEALIEIVTNAYAWAAITGFILGSVMCSFKHEYRMRGVEFVESFIAHTTVIYSMLCLGTLLTSGIIVWRGMTPEQKSIAMADYSFAISHSAAGK